MAGFRVYNDIGGADYVGKLARYHVAASHTGIIAPGDVVKKTGTAKADGTPEVDAATSAGTIAGVVVSVEYNLAGENLTDTGLPASTAGYVYVIEDPSVQFIAECDETLAVADTGLNVQPDWAAATKSGGLTVSNMKIDSSTKATTATLQFRILELKEDEDGVLGNRALVRINNGVLNNSTGA